MRRLYVICLLFILAASVFYLSYDFSKENMGKKDYVMIEDYTDSPNEILENTPKTAFEESRINNLTTIKMQINDLNTDSFEEFKINTPVEFLEFTKSDLLKYLDEYLKNPDKEDKDRGLIEFEMVKFSNKEVVIRKTYKSEDNSDKYIAVLENGYVTIYHEDGKTIYDYTDIPEAKLPADIVKSMDNGIIFDNISKLYEFLETYSS
ncbi:MAG: hypothetical protein ACI4GD_13405 [Lachnospiraceae bacterium]